jgi:hypothetical protein
MNRLSTSPPIKMVAGNMLNNSNRIHQGYYDGPVDINKVNQKRPYNEMAQNQFRNGNNDARRMN